MLANTTHILTAAVPDSKVVWHWYEYGLRAGASAFWAAIGAGRADG